MTDGSLSTKAELRMRHRELMQRMTSEQRHEASQTIFQKLLAHPDWQAAKRILLYSPLTDEPDLVPYLSPTNQPEKEFYMPRFRPVSNDFCAASFVDDWLSLKPGAFGIREPCEQAPELPLKQLDFIVVPGLAFDCQGHRLGRGKGFYDRLLAQTSGIKCGVAFDHQLVKQVPVEAHDVRLDLLFTPARWEVFSQTVKNH